MVRPVPATILRGCFVYPGYLDIPQQSELLRQIRRVVQEAPVFSPVTPYYGKPMTVQMTSAGRLGWYADRRRGYRYEAVHPTTGRPWPAIPAVALAVWHQVTQLEQVVVPDCCLINYYRRGARMGLHQDKDEGDFSWPVVSISLGDQGLFRVGGTTKYGTTESIWLNSGDVLVMDGESRLAFHGVDRIQSGTSNLLQNDGGGRLNLTLRVVKL